MTTITIECDYFVTVVGAVPASTMLDRMIAVPVDLFLPNKVGLLYSGDTTSLSGQIITRSILLQARPTTDATATATRFPGNVSGSPIDKLTLGVMGSDYAAPPIIGLSGGVPNRAGKAVARMGVDRVLIFDGGSGWSTATVEFVGGQLAPGGGQATGTVTIGGGAVTAINITSPGGPYQVPPVAVLTGDGGGTVLSPTLKVIGVDLTNPGFGYESAPPVVFTPFFPSCCPDVFPESQKAMVRNWMTAIFEAALRTPVVSDDPAIL